MDGTPIIDTAPGTGRPPEWDGTPSSYGNGIHDLDHEVHRLVQRAVVQYAMGQTWWHSAGPSAINGPAGPMAGYVIVLYTRSPLLGADPLMEAAFQVGFPTKAEIFNAVSTLMESLRRKADALKRP